jgi:hypothetical protein
MQQEKIIDGELYIEHEKIYFWVVEKAKISLQSPKTEFGPKIKMAA